MLLLGQSRTSLSRRHVKLPPPPPQDASLNMLLIDQFIAESDTLVCVNFILLLFFLHIIFHIESRTVSRSR
jgi:hypothetical protein